MLIRTILSILFVAMSFSTIIAQESSKVSAITFGNPKGEHRIEVFYDLQCGSCVSFHDDLKRVVERFPGRIFVIIRHFPLPMHEQAFMASSVAEAANRQGKGLEMVEFLLKTQEQWSTSEKPFAPIYKHAKQLGLDVERFRSDLMSDEVAQAVVLDCNRAKRLGLTYVPSTLLDGKLLNYAEAKWQLEEIISKGNK